MLYQIAQIGAFILAAMIVLIIVTAIGSMLYALAAGATPQDDACRMNLDNPEANP